MPKASPKNTPAIMPTLPGTSSWAKTTIAGNAEAISSPAIGVENNLIGVSDTPTAAIYLPIQIRRRDVEARLVLTDAHHPATNADPNLIRLLGQANLLAN